MGKVFFLKKNLVLRTSGLVIFWWFIMFYVVFPVVLRTSGCKALGLQPKIGNFIIFIFLGLKANSRSLCPVELRTTS